MKTTYWKEFGPRICRVLSEVFEAADFERLRGRLETVAKAPVRVSVSGLQSATTYLMVKVDGAIRVVFSFLDDPSQPESLMSIHDIVVPEDARGRGRGTAIVTMLLDLAEQKGIHTATINPSEADIIPFWQRFGFQGNSHEMKLSLNPRTSPRTPRVNIHAKSVEQSGSE